MRLKAQSAHWLRASLRKSLAKRLIIVLITWLINTQSPEIAKINA